MDFSLFLMRKAYSVYINHNVLVDMMVICLPIFTMAANLPFPTESCSNFLRPACPYQGVSSAPRQGLAPWIKFLLTTDSFLYLITDCIHPAPFGGRFPGVLHFFLMRPACLPALCVYLPKTSLHHTSHLL